MKITGYVKVIVWNPIEGEKQRVEKSNVITDDFLQSSALLQYIPSKGTLGGNNASIAVSTQTTTPIPSQHLIQDVYDNCTFIADSWSSTTDPAFGEKQGLLNPVGVSRTFWTVALTRGGLGNDIPALAYVKLDTECVQGVSDFVTIYYRVQFNDLGMQGYINPGRARIDFGKHLFNLDIPNTSLGFLIDKLVGVWSAKPDFTNYNYQDLNTVLDEFNTSNLIANSSVSPSNYDNALSVRVANHYKFKYVSSITRNTWVGIILNSMLRGISIEDNCAYHIDSFAYPDEPFQTGFWHQSGAISPFYNPASAGSSQGIIALSHDTGNSLTWNQIFPTLYKLTIHTGGQVGVATYSLSKRIHLGFQGNSYDSRISICPFRNNLIQLFPSQHGYKEEDNDIVYWSDGVIIQYDQNGVTKLNLYNGEYQTWDAETTPALTATDIRQVCCHSATNKIYVGCRASGIYVIDTSTNTIARPTTTPCYGIDINLEGKVFSLLNGKLVSSVDWTTDLGFSYDPNGDTFTNWSECYYLRVDPSSTAGNQKVGFVWNDTHNNSKTIVWWDENAPATTSAYFNSSIPEWAAGFRCSPINSLWVFSSNGLDFNSTFTNYFLSAPSQRGVNHSIWGSRTMYSISFLPNTDLLICFNTISDRNNNAIASHNYGNSYTSSYLTSIGAGIALSSEGLVCVDPRWKNYDWNSGTNSWDKTPITNNQHDASTAFKTTHGTSQALIDGLAIAFTNGGSTPHFAANEFFTQSVNYGLLKDNAVEITYKAAWYNKPVQFDGTATGTIPGGSPPSVLLPASSDPFFIRIETDSPELHQFQINGIDVAAIHVDGTPPGLNEVTLYGDGTVVFNAGDSGKSFTALKYAWIKD